MEQKLEKKASGGGLLDCDNLGIGLWKRGKVVHLFVLQFIEVGFRSRMKTNKALTAIRTASLHSHHGECYFSLMISNSIACSFWLIRSYLAYISQVEQCFSLIPNQPAVLSAMAYKPIQLKRTGC